MNFIDGYKDKALVLKISQKIKAVSKKNIKLMEVCGGHTMSIHKHGLPSLLPLNVELISGPGCPVCVTEKSFIDKAIALSKIDNTIVTTFGDLIRVPGSFSSLEKEKSRGEDIRIVYSPLESLEIAKKNPGKNIIFLGIGFETTAPLSALAVSEAHVNNLNNFYLLSAHKVMPPAMKALIDEGIKINGYICPGHVSTITGSNIYEEIVSKYKVGCVVSGFEPVDIMQSILMLVVQFENNEPKLEIEYTRAVTREGNIKALKLLDEVFYRTDDFWRGLGLIALSGLKLNDKYKRFDAEEQFDIKIDPPKEDRQCICGAILKGLKNPLDCTLFKKVCNPENPIGACMVSGEGACQAYYKYS
jgi:hydrogenase expression/formation protein HypD